MLFSGLRVFMCVLLVGVSLNWCVCASVCVCVGMHECVCVWMHLCA